MGPTENRHGPARGKLRPTRPGVSLLKPLYGEEPFLERNLASFCAQDYAGPLEVLFGVSDPDDPAVIIVARLRAQYPDRDLRLVVDGRRWGSNGKVSNLVNLAEQARHPVLVLADSDMLVGPDYLDRVVTALEEPNVGAVTCLYRGIAVPGVWSRLAVQWIDHHFLPSVAVGGGAGLCPPRVGWTHTAVGEAVRAVGLTVAVPRDLVLAHTCTAASFGALMRQELRWCRTIRGLDPAGFLGSAVTHPIPWATLAAFASGFGAPAMGMLGVAVASRLLLQLFVARRLGTGTKSLILGPVRDYAAFLVFVLSFWPGSIDWRGHRFALHTDGSISSPPQASRPGFAGSAPKPAPPDTAGS